MRGSLSAPQMRGSSTKAQALGRALESRVLAWEGNRSAEACKALFGPSGRLLTALIGEPLLSPTRAPLPPTATPGVAALESYLGEAEETGGSKFSAI